MRQDWASRPGDRTTRGVIAWLTRGLLLALLAVPITMVVLAASLAPSGAAVRHEGSQPGGPILECTFHDTKTGKYNTSWGYSNQTGQSYTVPVGQYNEFSSPAANAGQPTTFLAGTHDNVFVVTSSGTSSWTLGTVTVTAPGKACATNPVPLLPKGVPAWLTIGSLIAVILVGGLIVQRRIARGRLITSVASQRR